MAVVVRLQTVPIDPSAETSALHARLAGTGVGAVVTFAGTARPDGPAGEPVEALVLDWYPGMTERSLQDIADEAARRFGVLEAVVVHRCGEIPAGDCVVFVAAASAHRRAAFDAADRMMDRLKSEAAFWKRETGPAGDRWVEPTEADRAALARWGS
jgi:molybdopterin synthase catalytic subunit